MLLLERLSDDDLALLAETSGEATGSGGVASRLRADPARIADLIERPEVFRALFGLKGRDGFVFATPFLAFSVLLARAARELAEASFVDEWTGPGRRLPMFDVAALRDFMADRMRRLFLAEVLSSYTHVASGRCGQSRVGGGGDASFSELDPVQLAGLLDVVPAAERAGVYRRLGDLALFLTGVFPDHTATRAFAPAHADRLLRLAGLEQDEARRASWPRDSRTPTGGVALLERLGQRWYRLACANALVGTAPLRVVEEIAERFDQARRVLNLVTDRYLFPFRARWFPDRA